MIINGRNPKYIDDGNIDLEIDHPVYGWIPFTASEMDDEPMGRQIHAEALAGSFGAIEPYVPPEPAPPAVMRVTRRQARLALLDVGKLDAVENAVKNADRATQIEYEAETWESNNATIQGMWQQLGGTPEELIQLFEFAQTK